MKKIITLCLFAFAMVIGTQNITAQEKYKVMDKEVQMEAQDLKKILNLDNEQTALVARTIYVKEKSYADVTSNKTLDEKETAKMKTKIDMNFKSRMMEILTEDQFAAYSEYLSKKASEKK